MQINLAEHSVLILLFGQDGCEACAETLPIFRTIAREHPGVPTYAISCENQPQAADYYKVTVTPTTLLLRQGKIFRRLEGAVPKHVVERIFSYAEILKAQELGDPFFRMR